MPISITSIDHGYQYTKDNKHNIFKSAYSRINHSLTDKYKLIINGDIFYFGGGIQTADNDKSESIVNMVGTIADLVLQDNPETFLVVGLPITQYLEKRDKIADIIMGYNKLDVIYKGKQFKPNIKDVTVFAQGFGAIYNIGLSDGQYISFDIGSYTVNIVLIEIHNGNPIIKKYDTWYDGIMTLFNRIITEINKRFDLSLDTEYAEYIFKNGLSVYGEMQDLKFLNPIINDYLENIFAKFKTNYPYATTPILLSGGGVNVVGKAFTNYFVNAIVLPDAQFANANGYYKFGVQKYGKEV